MKHCHLQSIAVCAAFAFIPFTAYSQQQEITDGAGCDMDKGAFKAALLEATNESRSRSRECGTESFGKADPLTWNDTLQAVSQSHSADMARNNFFDHVGSDGLRSWDRANNRGYQYQLIGENISAGYDSVASVQQGWVKSPEHCSNLMNPGFTEMGAACVSDASSEYRYYWTAVYGTQSSRPVAN